MATIRIQVDGQPVDVPEGGNLLRALLAAGHAMPHPCYHPSLSSPASCRLCVAAIDGPDGRELVTTCNRTVQDGMVVHVDVPEVAAARAGLVDDLLLRHPPACAVCERAGECELQEAVHVCGRGHTPTVRETATERLLLGPRLVLDRQRCILCTRCVRFAEISGDPDLAVERTTAGARIAPGGNDISGPLTGNLVDLCPAGALSEPDARFAPPPWQLTGVASVCAGCASGCPTRADVHAGRVWRVKPRPVDEADGMRGLWLCDHGRYGWATDVERLLAPRCAGVEAGWDAALAAVAEAMERAAHAAVLLSPYLSNEETFLLTQLAQRWEAALFLWEAEDPDTAQRFPGGFAIAASRGPNAAGVRAVVAAVGQPLAGLEQLRDGLRGDLDALYAMGGSLHGETPVLEVPGDTFLVSHDVCASASAPADVELAGGSAWTEKEGTFVDGAGRLQRVRAAVAPPDAARADLWILAALWHGGPNRESAAEVVDRLAATGAAPFAGLDYGALDAASAPDVGVAFGGGWASWLQRQGLVAVEDHTRSR